jgi:predicted TIM-barrel fold metal-dependent hydrolase
MNTTLYKDTLPADYHAAVTAAGVNIVNINEIEASPRNDDSAWVLGKIGGDSDFYGYSAQLDIGSQDFITNLDTYAANSTACPTCGDMIHGLRVYLWGPSAGINLQDATQAANLAEVQKRGMTLDIISRGVFDATGKQLSYTNPKAQVIALAKMFPGIRIIIDHLGGAKIAGANPDPNWASDMMALGALPNVYMKFSDFYSAANATGDESKPWTAPNATQWQQYQPIFDVIWQAFGEDRIVFGSNWPVLNLGGSLKDSVAIAEAYLATKTADQRDKVMFRNGVLFYRRIAPQ